MDTEVRDFVEDVLYEASKAEERLRMLKNTLQHLALVHNITLDLDRWRIIDNP